MYAQILGRWQVQFFSIVVTSGDAWEFRKHLASNNHSCFFICIQQCTAHLTSPHSDGHSQSARCVPEAVKCLLQAGTGSYNQSDELDAVSISISINMELRPTELTGWSTRAGLVWSQVYMTQRLSYLYHQKLSINCYYLSYLYFFSQKYKLGFMWVIYRHWFLKCFQLQWIQKALQERFFIVSTQSTYFKKSLKVGTCTYISKATVFPTEVLLLQAHLLFPVLSTQVLELLSTVGMLGGRPRCVLPGNQDSVIDQVPR